MLLLTGCAAPQTKILPATIPAIKTEKPSPVSTAEQRQKLSRYAILAPTTAVNLWSLFDEAGASYENYALQGQYYPRLYDLAPPNNELTPRLADGFPSPIIQEGDYFTATVTLLPDQFWSDNTPITTEDIAFTINTALTFELGLNWAEFYTKEKLDHVEALDNQRIKYYFSKPPNTGDWQYGALIGVFGNKKYWQKKVSAAETLLPLAEDDLTMATYQTQIDALQAEAETIFAYMQTLKKKSAQYRGQEKLLIDRQFRRDSLKQKLELAQREKREKFAAARAALYALDNTDEPRIANKNTATYTLYQRDAAIQALLDNEIDFILSPNGLTPEEISRLSADSAIRFTENRRNDIRFLLFNPENAYLDDIAVRRALSCLIDPSFLADIKLEGSVAPALGWIPPEESGWHSGIIAPPCAGMDTDARLAAGTRILQMAGYAWEQAPSPNQVGSGLKLPSGEEFPSISILAPQDDPSRINAALYIEEIAQKIGIPLKAEIIPADALFFAVYGIGRYDLAMVGWSLSIYPDYLCDFFAAGNPYGYQNIKVNEKCATFLTTSDLTQAREELFEIEVLLWDDLPAVPLFSSKITEAYRNFTLPFEHLSGGFAHSFYGIYQRDE